MSWFHWSVVQAGCGVTGSNKVNQVRGFAYRLYLVGVKNNSVPGVAYLSHGEEGAVCEAQVCVIFSRFRWEVVFCHGLGAQFHCVACGGIDNFGVVDSSL